ncbi:MAG: GNAT family N-acetyltransferase [Myxococcales bacterium]|nr:GNAT family N-acetyltransferase [Myxococcales bacterium]
MRAATPADVPSLARVHVESWHHTYRRILTPANLAHTTISRSTARFRGYFWHGGQDLSLLHVLETGEGRSRRIVGYSNSGLSNSRRLAARGEIYELYLLPEVQGYGGGRKLLSAGLWALAGRRMLPAIVWALAENTRALRFYRSMRGREIARSTVVVGEQRLAKVAFSWSDYLPWPEHDLR